MRACLKIVGKKLSLKGRKQDQKGDENSREGNKVLKRNDCFFIPYTRRQLTTV